MGYREDVSLAIAASRWEEVVTLIHSELLTDQERKDVIQLLDDCDEHSVNPNGDHCLSWESIKTYTDDSVVFFERIMGSVDSEDWYYVALGEDGATDYKGCWDSNPFDLGVSHQMTTNTGGCEIWQGSGILASHNPTPAPAVISGPPVNDHACATCGNTACSSQEKSCWKCGAPIF